MAAVQEAEAMVVRLEAKSSPMVADLLEAVRVRVADRVGLDSLRASRVVVHVEADQVELAGLEEGQLRQSELLRLLIQEGGRLDLHLLR